MMMNFSVPFAIIYLICTAAGSGSGGSYFNEHTAAAQSSEPNLPIIAGRRRLDGSESVNAGDVRTELMPVSDTDYEAEDPSAGASLTDTDEMDGTVEPDMRSTLAAMSQQQTDFQDHFYLKPKFKEKEVPVPFTFSNFKRQQPPNFYTAAPAASQGYHNYPPQPSLSRGRSTWTAPDPSATQFTREVTIKQGRVKGIVRVMHPESGLRDVDQYLGLPYAESPVGNKRFMPPGSPPPWTGVKMANTLPPVCPQKLPKLDAAGPGGTPTISKGRYNQLKRLFPYLKVENEDCLYLNLYVPRLDGKPISKKYPVMVFIHGESYEWNSGNAYDGSVLASYGQVIVVTVNYRLGIFGFMKPGVSDHTVSNFGLFDQVAALDWIKGNIGAFGGDRAGVTLMGHGTGAALVNLLMVSPVAKGLFQRAILMSGSALSDWAITTTHALQSTLQVTQGLNCPLTDNQDEVLTCLRRKRVAEIQGVKTSSPEFSTSFGPVIDGLVIPNEPPIVMGEYSDLFSRYDLLFGVTELESYHTLDSVALEYGLLEREKNNLLRFYMQNRYEIRPDIALVATLTEYTDSYTDPKRAKAEEHRETLLEILSDARVVCPLIQAGLYHAKVNPRTYMYVFGHNSEAGDYAHLPLSVIGEELAYVFGAPLAEVSPHPRTFSAKERLLSEATMKYWTNFAKTGNPKAPWKDMFINLGPAEWQKYDVDWSEYEASNRTFLNLGLPPVVQHRYRQKYADFWNSQLPEELSNIKNMKQSPPYAEYVSPSHQPISPAPITPAIPQRGTSTNPFIDGWVNLYHNPSSRTHPTEDPFKLLQLMGRNPGVMMAHPETPEDGTTERIIIVNPANVLVQTADVTLYVLIFTVVLLIIVLVSLGIVLRRAYSKKEASNGKLNETLTLSSLTDKIGSDLDEGFIISTSHNNRPTGNKYESMKFCRNLLQKYNRKSKSQIFTQTTKVSEWISPGEMAKYSPKFESKLTLNRHSSFLGHGKPEKVSVAIDATPQTRSDSVLRQEPIEITKAKANYLHNNNDRIIICREIDDTSVDPNRSSSYNSYSSDSTSTHTQCSRRSSGCQTAINSSDRLDPANGQYEQMMEMSLGDDEQVTSFIECEDVNVTSKDDSVERDPLSPMETLSNIQRRNFPKVLPDYPKRHSLPPPTTYPIIDVHVSAAPGPQPPPRDLTMATLDRRFGNPRPPSRIFGASETRMALNPPQWETPPTTSSTLIVGPLRKKTNEVIYSTLKGKKDGSQATCPSPDNQSSIKRLSNRIPILKGALPRPIGSPNAIKKAEPAVNSRKIPSREDSTSSTSNDSIETVKPWSNRH